MGTQPEKNGTGSPSPVVLIGDHDGRLARRLRAEGTPSCDLPRVTPEEADVSFVGTGAERAVLCDPAFSRDLAMRWVHWALGRGMEMLVPVDCLPVLRRVGLAPRRWQGGCFYRFGVPATRYGRSGAFQNRFVALLVMPPALVLIGALALGVRLTDGAPVFFRQHRRGRRGRVFVLCKFRGMRNPASEDLREGTSQPILPDHPRHEQRHAAKRRQDALRTTPMGRFLRRYGLDELPQLFHILRGQMSWIGPRPLPLEDLRDVESTGPYAWLLWREAIVPGLTGLYQVCPRRRELGLHDMCVLDLYYLCNRGVRLDLWILARTLPAMARGWGGERAY